MWFLLLRQIFLTTSTCPHQAPILQTCKFSSTKGDYKAEFSFSQKRGRYAFLTSDDLQTLGKCQWKELWNRASPGFESISCVWSWANNLIHSDLTFFICEPGRIVKIKWDLSEQVPALNSCPLSHIRLPWGSFSSYFGKRCFFHEPPT